MTTIVISTNKSMMTRQLVILILLVLLCLLSGSDGAFLKIRKKTEGEPKKAEPVYMFYQEVNNSTTTTAVSENVWNAWFLLKHPFWKNHKFVIRKPRDAWQGVWGALGNVVVGYFQGVDTVIHHCWDGLFSDGLLGLAWGGLLGAAEGAAVVTGGLVAGISQLLQGLCNTPHAIQASQQGKRWSQQEEQWHYYSLDEEHHQQTRTQQVVKRKRRPVKEKEYYRLLKVHTDATSSEIKHAYYRQALKVHPDKMRESDEGFTEKFLQLSTAYKVLAKEETREAYDMYGKCHVAPQEKTPDVLVFFLVMFGSKLVEPYVGELRMASLLDDMMRVTRSHETEDAVARQARRVLDIALHVRKRIAGYVDGSVSEEAFVSSCRLEAYGILQRNSFFGDAFLVAIGRAVQRAALDNTLWSTLQMSATQLMYGYQTLMALLESFGFVMEHMSDLTTLGHVDVGDDCGGGSSRLETAKLVQRLEGTLPRAMRILWQLNQRDMEQTLLEACRKVMADGDRALRAKALRLLGREFYRMGTQHQRKDRWKDEDGMKESLQRAFEASTMPQDMHQ